MRNKKNPNEITIEQKQNHQKASLNQLKHAYHYWKQFSEKSIFVLCVFIFWMMLTMEKNFKSNLVTIFGSYVFSFWIALIFNGIHISARIRTTSSTLLKLVQLVWKTGRQKKNITRTKTIRKTLFDWEKNIAPVVKINIYWLDYYYYSGSGWDDDR